MNRPATLRIIALRILAVLVAAVVGLLQPATAHAAPPSNQYVALGDSYASGNGAGNYLSDGTGCHRSLRSYPGLVATANGLALNLQACSGATIADVSSRQLGALSASTGYVTVTAGGNDIGFADLLTTCLGFNTTACLNGVTAAEATITNVIPGRLDALFAAMKSRAPNARIVATSYPRLFNGRDCSLFTSFTSTEMTRLNAGADKLALAIQAAAARQGIGFSDVRTPFVRHAVCDSAAWINNVRIFTQYESFHPNATGHRDGYQPVVTSGLGVVPSPLASQVTTGGTTSSDTQRGTVNVGVARG